MAFKKAAKGFGVGLVVAAASLAVYYNMDQEDRARVINKLDNLQNTAEDKAESAEDKLKAAGHEAKLEAQNAWSKTKQETGEIKHGVEDKAQEAIQKGKEALHQVDGIAHDLAEVAKETIPKIVHDVDEKLHELKEDTKNLIHDYATSNIKPPPSVTGPVDKAPVRDDITVTKKNSTPMPPPSSVPNPIAADVGDSFTPVAALVAMNVSIAAFLGLAK
ncbi:hypothetical protein SARC_08410 [Sphaeroforma arctica JP610]|uniref:Uncharacterized protein n=1 Tax=Sphaeroforma arctica JP610 TaxID=667725 RepID=A0A0L0FQV7_9EUKA|nr:hypothetical protein SARC_08410 [Sphaeroforma arctica JP610]KNC79187.1 hypothetical protein SARC_08410 [Sphaeroforma arctica JP610]|eukprot:XP_014153089.1 hypothetical protein SARC_08410 [Sphaeroforma arctica JP610]